MTPESVFDWEELQARDLKALLRTARKVSWNVHGKRIQCFIPGRMVYFGERGAYPSISITGASCVLDCDHCHGKILDGMIPATDPETLKDVCTRLDKNGNIGILLSGGSDHQGALPWNRFKEAIRWVKRRTELKISAHTGLVDPETAATLKEAGIDELLTDVVGSDETMSRVYHLPDRLKSMESSLAALAATGLPLIPHIVLGLHYGRIKGELNALEMVAGHSVSTLVIVVLQPLKGTPMETVQPPEPEDVARFMAAARLRMPNVPFALSCARPPGTHRMQTDLLALKAGINRIAMPSEEMVKKAREIGLTVDFHKTCCSKSF